MVTNTLNIRNTLIDAFRGKEKGSDLIKCLSNLMGIWKRQLRDMMLHSLLF
jgi:hypothetical protein